MSYKFLPLLFLGFLAFKPAVKAVKTTNNVNDSVKIIEGAFAECVGTVQEINKEKHKVKVLISMFGRETPVELEFSQVEKI